MTERFEMIMHKLRAILTNTEKRREFQYTWLYRILCTISLVMSLVNVVTEKWVLMVSTLVFALFCFINTLLSRKGGRGTEIAARFFMVEIVALFTFFLVSGEPEGFAAIWTCLLPSCAMVLYGIKRGSFLSLAMLLITVLLLWTHVGESMLMFEYTASFHLRFPFLYCAAYFISAFLEIVRDLTQDELERSRAEYEHLYNHDQLTGLNNRYGFLREVAGTIHPPVVCVMMDMDLFKTVNDTYGHGAGDEVLRQSAKVIKEALDDSWTVSRWGGEEFVAVKREYTDPEEAGRILCEAFRKHDFVLQDGTVLKRTVSAGVVSVKDGEARDIDVVMAQADACLYRAKEGGRNRYIVEELK